VPTKYFRVDGADMETGNETYLVLQAKTRPQAETLAREQGLLISSVRIAKPDDWAASAPPDPVIEPDAVHSHHAEEPEPPQHPEPFIDQAPAEPEEPAARPLSDFHIPEPTAPVAPAPPAPATAAPILLACVGSALVIGGVVALVLALWPDNTLRNELQQVDFRIHELSQTILGAMLVLAGLIAFVLATICYLFPRRHAA
jgi:hypothetical protein